MSRYIDYDALDYRNDMMHGKSSEFLDGVIFMAQRIEEAPSINLDWIPCSERLPSEDGWYLIALAFEWGIEYEAGRWEDGMWWNPNSHVNVAWMPLPKQYEETEQ